MVNISITRISSKGQIVIPLDMRKDFNEGDKLILIKNNDQIILKKMEDFEKNLEQDLEFAKRTEEAYKRIEQGDFIELGGDKFLEELKKW